MSTVTIGEIFGLRSQGNPHDTSCLEVPSQLHAANRVLDELRQDAQAFANYAMQENLPLVHAHGEYSVATDSRGSHVTSVIYPVWPLFPVAATDSKLAVGITTNSDVVLLESTTPLEIRGRQFRLQEPSLLGRKVVAPDIFGNTVGTEAQLSAELHQRLAAACDMLVEWREEEGAAVRHPDYYQMTAATYHFASDGELRIT